MLNRFVFLVYYYVLYIIYLFIYLFSILNHVCRNKDQRNKKKIPTGDKIIPDGSLLAITFDRTRKII